MTGIEQGRVADLYWGPATGATEDEVRRLQAAWDSLDSDGRAKRQRRVS